MIRRALFNSDIRSHTTTIASSVETDHEDNNNGAVSGGGGGGGDDVHGDIHSDGNNDGGIITVLLNMSVINILDIYIIRLRH